MSNAGDIPRPEYPRPTFVRSEWLNLNGEWEFEFDDSDVGRSQKWYNGRVLPRRITVPFAYQCELSGINDKSIHEVVWYARTFDVPETWQGRDLLLNFGAVDYQCTVWVNGAEVGHNRGGHVPFSFDIAPYVKPVSNRLTVRVVDRQDATMPRGKQSSTGLPHGIDYYCTTGIWQTVWLEPVPPLRIDEVRVTPIVEEGAVHLHVYLHAPATGWRLEADALDGDRIIASASSFTAHAAGRVFLKIPDATLWTPETPRLYDIKVRFRNANGQLLDEIQTYAGIREVEIGSGRVVLNGKPLYMAMILDQGYWPDGYLTAPSDQGLREDVEWTKRFGFNGARKHQKIEDPRWLYWCDRLGLLVWGEMPNARNWSTNAEELLAAEWERAVRRDYNHPCIVAWVPVNESMGFPDLRQGHAGQYSFLERMVAATRRMDPNRPVVDNDGWEHTDVTDIVAIHDYSHTGDELRKRYSETVGGGSLPERTWTAKRAIFARGSRHQGQPIMLTEVGGILNIPPLPPEQRDRLYNSYASVQSNDELLARFNDVMQGIADLSFIAGFCYTQLTDIEQEINGLLTFDRRPKIEPERIAEINRRLFFRS